MNDYERKEKAAAAKQARESAARHRAIADTRALEALKRYLAAEEYHEVADKDRTPDHPDTR